MLLIAVALTWFLAMEGVSNQKARSKEGRNETTARNIGAESRVLPPDGWPGPQVTAERAIADFKAAIRRDPQCVQAFFGRGRLLPGQKDYDRAIADFAKVIALDPRHARAYFHRGLAYSDQEKYGPAMADLEKAIALDPQLASKPWVEK